MLREAIKKERLIPLAFDPMFKRVFGDENDKRPLEYLLKVILGMEVKHLIILNSEILGESVDSKNTTVDLIVTLEDGMKVGIEMNRTVSKEVIDRNLIYMFRIMANSLKHSEGYEQLDKHIQINFDMGGYHEKPIETYKIINTSNIHNVLTNKLEIIRIDVPYFTDKCYNEDNLNEQEKFIGLIGMTDRSKIRKVVGENDIMESIYSKIEDFSEDEKIAAMYDYDFHIKELARIAAKNEVKEELKKIEKHKEEIVRQQEKISKQQEDILKKKEIVDKEKEKVDKTKEDLDKEKEEILKEKDKILEEKKKIIKESTIKTAKMMLEENIEISLVSKITGLSAEELDNL